MGFVRSMITAALLALPLTGACEGIGSESCVVATAVMAGQEAVKLCGHVGPEKHACCTLLAARFDMERGCRGVNEVLSCALMGSATAGSSCGFPTAEACYVKEVDGVTEHWITPSVYDQFPNSSEVLGERCDQAMEQQLVSAPACP